MGYCKLECPDGETQCCICCEKQDGCDNRCDIQRIAKIMLRRTSHDYILIRTYTWNHIRSGWACMCGDHVR